MVGLICICLIISDVEYLFKCLLIVTYFNVVGATTVTMGFPDIADKSIVPCNIWDVLVLKFICCSSETQI